MNSFGMKQAAQYQRDGFLSPLPLLDPDEAASYRAKLEYFEDKIGGRITTGDVDGKHRYRCTLCFPGRTS